LGFDFGACGAAADFCEPGVDFLIRGDVGVGGVVCIDERGIELTLNAYDFGGVVQEGETLEWGVTRIIDETAGFEIGFEVVGREGAVLGPVFCYEVAAAR
jgi:hypothetical protein